MERWFQIEDMNYSISSYGNIKSHNTGKIMKPATNNRGYKTIVLYKNNKAKGYLVHRLVALAFIDNPYLKDTVNHKDGNLENNNVDNLEWATYSENNKHSYDALGKVHPMLGKSNPTTASYKKVSMYSKDGIHIKDFDSITIASREIGASVAAISHNITGRSKSSGGYIWKLCE